MSERIKQSLSACLLGIADHQGVINVGGRIGAAHGPRYFRKSLARMKGERPVREGLRDLGDVVSNPGGIVLTHQEVASRIAAIHADPAAVSLIVGGGHDHAAPHLKGLVQAGRGRLGCINIDAHLDVRKPSSPDHITSGSPFYLALESGTLSAERLIEFGIQNHCNGAELWQYVRARKVEVIGYETLRNGKAIPEFHARLTALAGNCDGILVSLDLDSIAEAFAPGVSAPQSEGFTPTEIMEMMEVAGGNPKVISLGIYELNPEHDPDGRTARLAATAAYHFLDQVFKRRAPS